MSEVIRVTTGIKRYDILNENDEKVAELVIDTNDTHLLSRFIELYDNVYKIQDDCGRRLDNIGIEDDEQIEIEDAKKILSINEDAVNQIIAETEKLFGNNLFHEMYRENYDMNPEFVPDIALLQNFFEQIMPIVRTVLQKKSKYSPNKKGRR